MLQDLDATLSALLTRQLPPDLVSQIAISFLTPDDQFPPASITQPAVDLFLYDISENRDLRLTQPSIQRGADGRAQSFAAPARVDCAYLVTAWAKAGTPTPDQDEHRMLGEVLKVLLFFREIPAEVLQGSLRSQPSPLRTAVAPLGSAQTRGELWQALGDRPRAAINYVVTLSLDVPQPPADVGVGAVDLQAGGA